MKMWHNPRCRDGKTISSHPGRDVLNSVLKVRNARVKVEWAEREEELSVICVKVVVEGKDRP